VARRAGCGVAAKGGVIYGCYAAYTTSVTFGDSFSSRRSLCAFGAIDNNLYRKRSVFFAGFHAVHGAGGHVGKPIQERLGLRFRE